MGIFLPFQVCSSYYMLSTFIYHEEEEPSPRPSPLLLIIHYLLYFVVFLMLHIHHRKNIKIGAEVLTNLLEEVAEKDLMGDPEAWRMIAFKINKYFRNGRHDNSIFYSGEQCRRVFVREIVNPVESKSYYIRCYHNEVDYKSYCGDSQKHMLAERAVANYNKSNENRGELSDADEEDD